MGGLGKQKTVTKREEMVKLWTEGDEEMVAQLSSYQRPLLSE